MQNNIRRIREEQGYSLEKLANLVGTDRSQIHRLENGQRSLTQAWMERLSRALQCTPADLIDPALYLAEGESHFRHAGRKTPRKVDPKASKRLMQAMRIALELVRAGKIKAAQVETVAMKAADMANLMETEVTPHLVMHALATEEKA